MANSCDICGKGKQFGHNVSFSQRKTAKTFRPNLHTKSLTIDGKNQTLKICSQCLRSLKKHEAKALASAAVQE